MQTMMSPTTFDAVIRTLLNGLCSKPTTHWPGARETMKKMVDQACISAIEPGLDVAHQRVPCPDRVPSKHTPTGTTGRPQIVDLLKRSPER